MQRYTGSPAQPAVICMHAALDFPLVPHRALRGGVTWRLVLTLCTMDGVHMGKEGCATTSALTYRTCRRWT